MTSFWVIAAVMTVGCFAWLLPTVLSPLRQEEDTSPSHDEHALASYTERLDAVEQEHADGALTEEQLEEARHELARELLQDTRPESVRAALNSTASVWIGSAVVLLALPLLAIPTYLSLGNLASIGMANEDTGPAAQVSAAAGANANGDMPSIEEMVAGLAQRLADNPEDAQGWLMLGRSYLVLNRLKDAEDAYAKAYALVQSRVEVLTGYAEAIARNNNNSLIGRPQELLKSALAISPKDTKTLWLSGISAMQRGDGAVAIKHWKALKATQALNAEETVTLDQMIAEAGGEAPSSITEPRSAATAAVTTSGTKTAAAKAKASGVAIAVTVSLAPKLASKVTPGDTLFVFARAQQGPPMPLAVARMPVPTFPITVQLDESMAMMPQMTLATFPRVVIGARISKSGNAQGKPGDLQGLSEGVTPASTNNTSVAITEIVGQK
jgi:cytochrome c-type biogenesis protein CcmH